MSSPSRQGTLTWQEMAKRIDHTLLRPDATREQVTRLCEEARHFNFAAVVVNPCHVALAARLTRDSPVKVATVIGFPLGATLTTVKRFEAAEALRLGADELDMVINVGALKSGDRQAVANDIAAVVEVAHRASAIVKVILETALLTLDEKKLACDLCVAAEADYVKTSTGFGPAGATVEDVALLRRAVGNRAGVKAAGGIRTARDAAAMIEAGADRVGASASVPIMQELGAPAL
ncbi:MAG: deoxyribose-phosphate aldolase [Acidobacteriaceae bacterium]|nr:deoxyribose-phosphate aldolase [Acidobacteriaceae bacterium]